MDELVIYVSELEANEGLPADDGGAFPYLDTRGLCTFGIGCMVPSEAEFLKHPWTGDAAYAYQHLMAEGQSSPPHIAMHYRHITTARLPLDYCRQLCRGRLAKEFLPAIDAALGGTTVRMALPTDAISVLVDCAWTTGAAGFAREWPHLIAACKARDWPEAEQQCMSKWMGASRAKWRRDLLWELGA